MRDSISTSHYSSQNVALNNNGVAVASVLTLAWLNSSAIPLLFFFYYPW
jgi:hypothetical protein